MNVFLNDDEVIELTRRVRYSAQRRVLNAMGIQYKPRPDGSIAVLRTHVEKIFGNYMKQEKTQQSIEPNWNGVNA